MKTARLPLKAIIQRLRQWHHSQPEVRLATPENLRKPLDTGQRRLVVGGKIIIFNTEA